MSEHKEDEKLEEEITNPLNCPLYSKCNGVYSSHQLLAQEVTQIKNSEIKAAKDRKEQWEKVQETASTVHDLSTKLDRHTEDFQEMLIIVKKLQPVITNQKWMQVIAYVFGGIVTTALVILFTHANNSDKESSAINETLKNNTKAIETQNGYMREAVKELRDLNAKNIEAIIELKTKVNQIEINQNRNYGQIEGLKSNK